eukprot:TRINITY_DN4499_c0_g2_i1.p1 TRINITY_DN4499_c0_g2~~TRINITY_DN4499_c0_g2_i1.p1  ORF type:complete len:133 (+),score=29.30 TRINITY_DN4499_c0_g2_i1:46-399(+)
MVAATTLRAVLSSSSLETTSEGSFESGGGDSSCSSEADWSSQKQVPEPAKGTACKDDKAQRLAAEKFAHFAEAAHAIALLEDSPRRHPKKKKVLVHASSEKSRHWYDWNIFSCWPAS